MSTERGEVVNYGGFLQFPSREGYAQVQRQLDQQRTFARREGLKFRSARRKVRFDHEILTFGCWSMRRKVK